MGEETYEIYQQCVSIGLRTGAESEDEPNATCHLNTHSVLEPPVGL